MGSSKKYPANKTCRLDVRQVLLLFLLLVVFSRAIVPPGYMPAPLHSGTSLSMFMLCGGDVQSVQLIAAWHDVGASGHSHGASSASLGFELCEFDALSFIFADLSISSFSPFIGATEINGITLVSMVAARPHPRNNRPRAPPLAV